MWRQLSTRSTRRAVLGALLGVAGLIAGCLRRDSDPDTAPAGGTPGPARAWRWEIRWIRGTPKRPPDAGAGAWQLRIDGLVAEPRALTLAAVRALPAVSQRSRMKCVECWSAPAVWRGVRGADLLALVERRPGADYVTLHAADGYDSTVHVVDMADERTVFAYEMDGEPLSDEHGYPLRLILPAHYGYKGVKAIVRLELTDGPRLGYWESRGYDDEGLIMAGIDRPLDLGGRRDIKPGEITDY